MKKIIILSLFVSVLGACNNNTNESANLPGTYVRETSDEYGKVWDTLHISKATSSTETVYGIIKRSKVEHLKMIEGMNTPIEYKVDSTLTGKYNKEENTFDILPKGSTYAVDMNKGILTNGKVTYTRIKE